MDDKTLNGMGAWLNTKGFDIDLTDDFWMEELRWDEHKTKDIIELITEYSESKLAEIESWSELAESSRKVILKRDGELAKYKKAFDLAVEHGSSRKKDHFDWNTPSEWKKHFLKEAVK